MKIVLSTKFIFDSSGSSALNLNLVDSIIKNSSSNIASSKQPSSEAEGPEIQEPQEEDLNVNNEAEESDKTTNIPLQFSHETSSKKKLTEIIIAGAVLLVAVLIIKSCNKPPNDVETPPKQAELHDKKGNE